VSLPHKDRQKKFIAFDLGAESGRCVVVQLSDQRILLEEVHRFATHNVRYEKGFHWDVLALYQEIIEGLSEARKAFGSQFDGIAVDTWGVDYVLVDAEGRIIGYPYHYRDDRTDAIMQKAFAIVPKEKLYARTGIQFAQFNTVFQLLAEKERSSSFLELAHRMLLMPDFLNYLLSGVMKSEYSITSTTSLTDPLTRDWAWDLIDLFGFPRKLFQDIVAPGTVIGTLLPSVAAATGLQSDIPVIATAGHDTAAAVMSVPTDSESDWAFLSSGTWSLMGVEADRPMVTPEAMEHNFTNEGGVAGTTRFLKNIIGLWPLQECRRDWAASAGDYGYPVLAELARRHGPAHAWVDLNDPRFFKAGDMPKKVLAYLHETAQPVKQDIGYVVRVIMETLAFNYRQTVTEIGALTGRKVVKLHAVGGGIQNELLMQLTADALGRTVLAGPTEGTVIGNVGGQALATGTVTSVAEWRRIVADSIGVNVYRPGNTEYFDDNDGAFKSVMCT
jgi:rhamnulokinase